MDNADEATRPAMQEAYGKAAAKLRAQNAEYKQFCEDNGLKTRQDRVSIAGWDRKQAAQARAAENALKKERCASGGERNLALGLRQPPQRVLTDEEREGILLDADAIGLDRDILDFDTGYRTAFNEALMKILVHGDILPDLTSKDPRDRMSSRAVLAHEYYGHYKAHPSPYQTNDWRDEFYASYNAALYCPNLSDEDRGYLILDAYGRAERAGVRLEYSREAKQILYGYGD